MTVAFATPVDVPSLFGRLGVMPTRITADSRKLRTGDAFAAFPGMKTDGRAFIGDAIRAGASAVLWEVAGFHWNPAWQVANQAVDGLKKALGAIADLI